MSRPESYLVVAIDATCNGPNALLPRDERPSMVQLMWSRRKTGADSTEEAERVDRGRLERVLADAHEWLQARAPGGPVRLVGRVRLLVMMGSDYIAGRYTRVPVTTIWIVFFALLYVVGPLDLIPDFIPGFGWLDDAFVIALVCRAIRRDLKRYCRSMGLDTTLFGV